MRTDRSKVSRPLEDYALIGDKHTAALVGINGSIDWLCVPRFDSGACFAALLGDNRNGCWRISPKGVTRATRRRYRGETLVLETEFETPDGAVRLIDFMPVRNPARERACRVIRIVEGLRGRVQMEMEFVLRFDYGITVPWVRAVDGERVAIAGPDAMSLHSAVKTFGKDLTTRADFTVSEGDRLPFVLSWFESQLDPPADIDAEKACAETERIWQEWSRTCRFDGEWHDDVVRSLLTLKALTYAPTGGIVAAPTASLPEALGGVRNWDYRYCWVRDATLTLYALVQGGYRDEAAAWRDWLLRAVAGHASQLQILYGVAGERRIVEQELDWLPGYEKSKPVRIGNAAVGQLQLDVFGEIMDAMYASYRVGLPHPAEAWALQRHLVDYLATIWSHPDDGIWEVRGGRKHFTHSKVMAWVALDRGIKAIENVGLQGPLDHWKQVREEIHQDVLAHGYNPDRKSFVQSYGSRELDASLLLIPTVGFLPPTDERVIGTVEAIQRELVHEGFVLRYDSHANDADGLPPGEGAFLPCTFWLADALLMIGRPDEARRIFDRLLKIRNDVGLLAEEYDVEAGRMVGNFPQAFSHIAVVNTASNLHATIKGTAEHRANH